MSQNNREQLRRNQAAQAKQQRLTRIIGVGAAVLVIVLIGVFVGVLVQNQGKQATASSATPPNASSDAKAIVVNPGKAKAGAPVVELFFDYQCPNCKVFEGAYGPALTALADTGDIDLRYRNMTFLDNNLNNDASLRAGIGAACSDFSGKYAAYHEQIYANQPTTEGAGYTDDVLRNTIPAAAGITGAELASFQSCFDQQATEAFVNGTNELATKDQVNSTPTLHVNGKNLTLQQIGSVQPSALGDLIMQNA